MLRSPPILRSRGKPVADKEQVGRSLSVDSGTATDIAMPQLSKVDTALIEDCVNKQLLSDSVLEALASRLSDRLKTVIQEAVSAALDIAHQQITKLTEEVTSLKCTVSDLRSQLEYRTDDLEQYQRRTNLRVFGIPENKGEVTDELVLSLINDQLQVEMPLQSIDRSHRVGRQSQPGPDGKVRPRPIIVRFTSYRERHRVFQAKKRLKNTGMTIREDLTACRLRVYQAAAQKYGHRHTWTTDGRIQWVTGEENDRQIHTAIRLCDVI